MSDKPTIEKFKTWEALEKSYVELERAYTICKQQMSRKNAQIQRLTCTNTVAINNLKNDIKDLVAFLKGDYIECDRIERLLDITPQLARTYFKCEPIDSTGPRGELTTMYCYTVVHNIDEPLCEGWQSLEDCERCPNEHCTNNPYYKGE